MINAFGWVKIAHEKPRNKTYIPCGQKISHLGSNFVGLLSLRIMHAQCSLYAQNSKIKFKVGNLSKQVTRNYMMMLIITILGHLSKGIRPSWKSKRKDSIMLRHTQSHMQTYTQTWKHITQTSSISQTTPYLEHQCPHWFKSKEREKRN